MYFNFRLSDDPMSRVQDRLAEMPWLYAVEQYWKVDAVIRVKKVVSPDFFSWCVLQTDIVSERPTSTQCWARFLSNNHEEVIQLVLTGGSRTWGDFMEEIAKRKLDAKEITHFVSKDLEGIVHVFRAKKDGPRSFAKMFGEFGFMPNENR